MPRQAKELTAIEVRRLTDPGMHFVGTVPGLALQVTDSGARTWVLRATVGAKRREMGLGGYPAVTLADAHRKAREARETIAKGVDPIDAARAARSELRAAQAAALTFEQCAAAYIAAHRAGWRNAKHAQQWTNTLAQHAFPTIGALLVRDVSLPHVMSVLEPIWRTKTETASRVRSRIELILDWAAVRGYREKDNPARWRGHLDKVLPKPSKVAKVRHHPAIAYAEAGAFMAALREQPGIAARALEFAVLTAARSGEVRGALWAEIDLTACVWVVPGDRMKAGKEHRVPLSKAAVALLSALTQDGPLVFSAPSGGTLSDMALTAVMRRMGSKAVPHGFRSTFRDWAAEVSTFPRDMAEMALAHAIDSKVEAAYRRGDALEKRRAMMDAWAGFLNKRPEGAAILQLAKKRA